MINASAISLTTLTSKDEAMYESLASSIVAKLPIKRRSKERLYGGRSDVGVAKCLCFFGSPDFLKHIPKPASESSGIWRLRCRATRRISREGGVDGSIRPLPSVQFRYAGVSSAPTVFGCSWPARGLSSL